MQIVITMTSWTKRIQYVAKAIYRFLKTQTVKPDMFYLWLAEEEFPNKEKDLPEDLLAVCSAFNVQIKWTKDNEYCFKRWYVFPEHNKDLVISIDDDVIYDPTIIERCIAEYNKNPIPQVLDYPGWSCEVSIIDNIKYALTKKIVKSSVKNYFMGQCAFTPNSFPLETLNKDVIALRKKICPKCDESFLHPYLIKNGIPITMLFGTRCIEEAELQKTGIRNDLHFNLVNVNGKEYKKADLYKLKVLQAIPELQESWKKEFPNYDFDYIKGIDI